MLLATLHMLGMQQATCNNRAFHTGRSRPTALQTSNTDATTKHLTLTHSIRPTLIRPKLILTFLKVKFKPTLNTQSRYIRIANLKTRALGRIFPKLTLPISQLRLDSAPLSQTNSTIDLTLVAHTVLSFVIGLLSL